MSGLAIQLDQPWLFLNGWCPSNSYYAIIILVSVIQRVPNKLLLFLCGCGCCCCCYCCCCRCYCCCCCCYQPHTKLILSGINYDVLKRCEEEFFEFRINKIEKYKKWKPLRYLKSENEIHLNISKQFKSLSSTA